MTRYLLPVLVALALILIEACQTTSGTVHAFQASLTEKQVRFAYMAGRLLTYADTQSIPIILGDAYRDPRAHYGHPHSLHHIRLALDVLVVRGGHVVHECSEDYAALGEFWTSLGGNWGGAFGDCGHFSLSHGGMT